MAKILIGYSACPLTRAAFEKHGHDVWTCDLLPARGLNPKHFQCDIWEVAELPGWDFGLFHPMCTVLTTSGAWAFEDPDFKRWPGVGYHQKLKPTTLAGAARRAQRDIELDNFRRLLRLPYQKAIENPGVSFINTTIRPPTQIIHPYQHGDDASKATGLWLADDDGWVSRTIPRIVPTAFVEPRWCPGKKGPLPRWSNQTDAGQNRESPGDDRWLKRSETYPGIAAAWGDQWGRYLKQKFI